MRRALAVLVVACVLVVDAPGVAADDLTPQCRIWRTGETRPMNTGWADWCANATPTEAAGYWMCR